MAERGADDFVQSKIREVGIGEPRSAMHSSVQTHRRISALIAAARLDSVASRFPRRVPLGCLWGKLISAACSRGRRRNGLRACPRAPSRDMRWDADRYLPERVALSPHPISGKTDCKRSPRPVNSNGNVDMGIPRRWCRSVPFLGQALRSC